MTGLTRWYVQRDGRKIRGRRLFRRACPFQARLGRRMQDMGKRRGRKKDRISRMGKTALFFVAAVFMLHKKEWKG